MLSKYKFYIIGGVAVLVGLLVWFYGKKKSTSQAVVEKAAEDVSSKLSMSNVTGNKTSNMSLIRGLSYNG